MWESEEALVRGPSSDRGQAKGIEPGREPGAIFLPIFSIKQAILYEPHANFSFPNQAGVPQGPPDHLRIHVSRGVMESFLSGVSRGLC